MIETVDVAYSYNKNNVLRDVNIRIDRGLTLFRGPNGSGKTTLAKVISGLLPPQRGNVYIDGVDIYSGEYEAREKLRGVVYIHDSPVILRGTVYKNLTYGLRIMKKTNYTLLSRLIDIFDLKKLVYKEANELSAGEKQIVSLIRGFSVDPQYLVLDEPLQYLDDDRRRKVVEYLGELRTKGMTIIVATHEQNLMEWADRIYYIKYGSVEMIT